MKIKAKHIMYVGAFIVLTILGIITIPKNEEILVENSFVSDEAETKKESTIFVHIIGAVNDPGIKEVPKYTRVYELIELSGGATEDADLSKINLASVLKDEQKIVIPSKIIESENKAAQKAITSNLVNSQSQININYASIEELTSLPGIGNAMAKRIVDYRETTGSFNDIEDIMNVSRNRRV